MLDHNISHRMVVMIAVWINRTSAPANGRLLFVCLNDALSIADVNAWVFFIRASVDSKSDDSWGDDGCCCCCISLLLYKTLESGSVYAKWVIFFLTYV